MRLTFVAFSEMSQQLLNALPFDTHTNVSLRVNCNNFGDTLTFCLAPLSGQNVYLSMFMSKIPVKLMTSPSVSAVLVCLVVINKL